MEPLKRGHFLCPTAQVRNLELLFHASWVKAYNLVVQLYKLIFLPCIIYMWAAQELPLNRTSCMKTCWKWMRDRIPISWGLLYCFQLGEVSLFCVERKRSQYRLFEVPYLEELWIQKGTLKHCKSLSEPSEPSLHQSTKKNLVIHSVWKLSSLKCNSFCECSGHGVNLQRRKAFGYVKGGSGQGT